MAGVNNIGDYEIYMDEKSFLGRGSYGDVRKAINNRSKQKVAAKSIPWPEEKEFERYLDKEVDILKAVTHPNIVMIYDVERTDRFLYLFLELCQWDLNGYVKEQSGLPENTVFSIIRDTAQAIDYLHSRNPVIVHRDLKPENLLIKVCSGLPTVKVTDFGFATQLESSKSKYTATMCGTENYMSPEMFPDKDDKVRYNKEVDTFSLGVIFLALIKHEANKPLQAAKALDVTTSTKADHLPLGKWMWTKASSRQPYSLTSVIKLNRADSPKTSMLKLLIRNMLLFTPLERVQMGEICDQLKEIQDMEAVQESNACGNDEFERMKKTLEDERLKKIQAVNKLAEIMNRRDSTSGARVSLAELNRKDKENRKLKQELTLEKNKFSQIVDRHTLELEDVQAMLNEERKRCLHMQLKIDAKDSEIDRLKQKNALLNTASVSSGNELDEEGLKESQLEGWLATPNNRQDMKKYVWKEQYVLLSSSKMLFFENEAGKHNSYPIRVLDIDRFFHVRPVTQGDVIRAEAKDIPCIFQVLYATEGEVKMPGDPSEPHDDKGVPHKGHDFVVIHFRTPTTCECCNKPLWHMLHPPTALECRRCHVKVHKDHLDKKEEFIGYCTVNLAAKPATELLLLARSQDDKMRWVQRLSKKIVKKGAIKGTPTS